MPFNTNYDTFYKGEPIFASNTNYKVDTLVDIRAVKGKNALLFHENLIIEEKFYAKSYTQKVITHKKLAYYPEASMRNESKVYEAERKMIANRLRKLKKDEKDAYDDYKDSKREFREGLLTKEEAIKEKENYIKKKQKRDAFKDSLRDVEKVKTNIQKKYPSSSGTPVEITKHGISPELLEVKTKDENIKAIQKKALGKAGWFTLDEKGLTSPIYNKEGELQKVTRVVKWEDNGVPKEKEFTTQNSDIFKNRYLVTAVADNNKLSFDWVSKNITPINISELGKSAYGKAGESTSVRTFDRPSSRITFEDIEEGIKNQEEQIRKKEEKIKKNKAIKK
jgi:hypothetical protein